MFFVFCSVCFVFSVASIEAGQPFDRRDENSLDLSGGSGKLAHSTVGAGVQNPLNHCGGSRKTAHHWAGVGYYSTIAVGVGNSLDHCR